MDNHKLHELIRAIEKLATSLDSIDKRLGLLAPETMTEVEWAAVVKASERLRENK